MYFSLQSIGDLCYTLHQRFCQNSLEKRILHNLMVNMFYFVKIVFLIHLDSMSISNFQLNPIVSEVLNLTKRMYVKYIFSKRYNNNILYLYIWSAVVLGINSTSNAGSNFHEAKPCEISSITSAINP